MGQEIDLPLMAVPNGVRDHSLIILEQPHPGEERSHGRPDQIRRPHWPWHVLEVHGDTIRRLHDCQLFLVLIAERIHGGAKWGIDVYCRNHLAGNVTHKFLGRHQTLARSRQERMVDAHLPCSTHRADLRFCYVRLCSRYAWFKHIRCTRRALRYTSGSVIVLVHDARVSQP